MNKLVKRGLLGLAAIAVPVSAAVAMSPAAFASTSHVDTTTTGVVNSTGYVGTLHHTNTTNSQWSIDSYTLHVVGQYGWTNDFVLNAQTPVGNHSAAIVSGSVTDTTEYGSSTQNFTISAADWAARTTPLPFTVAADGHIIADSAGQGGPDYQKTDPAATAFFQAEVQMVYHTPGAQNAGYWFGNVVA